MPLQLYDHVLASATTGTLPLANQLLYFGKLANLANQLQLGVELHSYLHYFHTVYITVTFAPQHLVVVIVCHLCPQLVCQYDTGRRNDVLFLYLCVCSQLATYYMHGTERLSRVIVLVMKPILHVGLNICIPECYCLIMCLGSDFERIS